MGEIETAITERFALAISHTTVSSSSAASRCSGSNEFSHLALC